ncbi:MAG: peptidase domain-containing ABC transporter [Gammaproteobacteria bacterium]|nr:peptidase domain-containing ABC transporter [Gammaproteobacteria bacterium]MDP2139586.1 peptidase domain-containing ABC transporter [Gammaproteobacteria bacterium]MDP2346559.1 peptidase domain-containing ABC transporter [Gammaproteobacteria bacterium]
MIDALFRPRHSLPTILQSERAECGLACIAMVSSWFGRRIDLNTLRREYPISARGASLSDILNIATALDLNTRPLKVELQDLQSLQLPAVLHWDMTHFVVVKKVTASAIVIHDPAVGERRYSMAEVSRHFTGIAVEFSPGVAFKSQTQLMRSRLIDLFERYPGFHTAVTQLFLLSLLLQLASIGSAFYMQLVIDEGLAKQDRDFLTVLAIGFFMLGMTTVAMTYARAQVQLYFSNQLGFQMVSNVFHHLISLPVEYFERRHVGDLVSRFGSIREIRRIITEDLITVVLDGLFALLTLAVMFYFNVMLASVVLVFVTIVTVFKIALIPKIQVLQEQKIVADAVTSTNLMENMRTIEIIKFYCRELPRIMLWRNYYADQINTNVVLTRFTINIDAVYGLLFALENVLVVYLAAMLVLEGQITLGFLTAFVALKGNFSSSIRSFIEKIVQIRLVKLQLERVSDITCTEREFDNLYLPKLRQPVQGALTLENVSYTYPGTTTPVLQSIDLDIAAGEIIAIVGPSGSGKSTLMKIMAGLFRPSSGTLKVDSQDVQQFGMRQYRSACAGILQTDQLLSGTIMDNITLFDEEVDHARLQRAGHMARIDQFIQTLPMGYNSMIGDMGSIMSSGQGQRILLARAFYKTPRILFLDEATANLDPETEAAILDEIVAMKTTVIFITHRKAPLAIANRVFTCADGRIDEVS